METAAAVEVTTAAGATAAVPAVVTVAKMAEVSGDQHVCSSCTHLVGSMATARETGRARVTVMDRDKMSTYQALAAELRGAGLRAEVYLGNPKNFGNQLKYADQRDAPIAIIEGQDERERGMVQIKDLVLGAQIAKSATLDEWKDRPSQYEVARGDMLAKIREILAGQG